MSSTITPIGRLVLTASLLSTAHHMAHIYNRPQALYSHTHTHNTHFLSTFIYIASPLALYMRMLLI